MDEEAKRILLKAYWGTGGWKNGDVDDDDFQYAREHGVMFAPISLTHAQLVRETIAARDAIGPKRCGNAFIASLASRKVWLRSALGSFGNCVDLNSHRFSPHPMDSQSHLCRHCDSLRRESDCNLNVLSFERLKWGGVRHHQLVYNRLDLTMTAREEIDAPTASDRRLLERILRDIRDAVGKQRTGALKKSWATRVPGNSDEFDTMLNVLTYAGVIEINGSKIVGCNEQRIADYFESS